MADLLGGIPLGIDDLKASAVTAANALATGAKSDLTGATGFSIGTDGDTQEARGDNTSYRKIRTNKSASGSFSLLQHDENALATIADGATSVSGTSPAAITKYIEPATPVMKKYQLEAQAYDGVSATRVTVYRANTSSGPSIDWSTDEFSEVSFDFDTVPFTDGAVSGFFKIENYETGVAITATNP